ncbi:MAG: acyl carrier protein [Clostridia bacterium]|nr:acyl carrier protein [Clostridia bacterium]MDD3092978.1 acyl carrier protein [Clostridia bacterium]MDD3971839.1 acyl carrier protein [Clostridia bacterium]MDD4542531.1 acyl carrier protein [Clostridia bacterium]NLB80675.1 acyl carrier protein [Clostridiaceae bacterium]
MYNFSDVRLMVINTLESIGVIVDDSSEDVNLQSLAMESIMFIMLIVEIEDTLNIAIPSEYLFYDNLVSLNGFVNQILVVLEQKK